MKAVFLFFSTLFMGLVAQEKAPDFHNYFYDQRRSFFEAMPVKTNEIVMLGHSITNCANWDELIPNQHLLNRGISGDITAGALDRIDEINARKPKKVFIMLGINDIAAKIDKKTILDNHRKIIQSLQKNSPKTKIYIQSILPTNDAYDTFKNHQGKMDIIKEVNVGLALLALETKTVYLDLFPAFLDPQGKLSKQYTNDGLHLLGPGYVLWASIIKKHL